MKKIVLIIVGVSIGLILTWLALAFITVAHSRPGPQWANEPLTVQKWFQSLMQPDKPTESCCGEADAFEADTFETDGDHYVAVITDGKGVIPSGTRIPVPNTKMKWDSGNPTGHGIIFLSSATTIGDPPSPGYVYVLRNGTQARMLYCYVAPGGV